MIVTQKQPQVLWNLYHVYKKANQNGNAFNNVKKCLMHNNQPVNILIAIKVLKDVKCLFNIKWCHELDYEYTLRYISEITGYSVTELNERV